MLKYFLSFVMIILMFGLKADHLFGGNISYKYLSDRTYEVTVTLYSDDHNNGSDKEKVFIEWGDGKTNAVSRTNGNGSTVAGDKKKSVYVGEHTYDIDGNYRVFIDEEFRVGGIDNITAGQSFFTKLYLEAIIPVYTDVDFCKNNSVTYGLTPIFDALVGKDYACHLGVNDVDGDSLAFEMVDCKSAPDVTVPGFYVPGNAKIDAKSGLITWNSATEGSFCLAIKTLEFRNGKEIGSSTYDITINMANFTINEPEFFADAQFLASGNNLVLTMNAGDNLAIEDSIFYNLIQGLTHTFWHNINSSNSVIDLESSSDTTISSSITWQSLVGDENQMPYFLVHRVTATSNGRTFRKDFVLLIEVLGDKVFDCTSSTIEPIFELPPDIFAFDIAPNISDDAIWINVGDNFTNMTVELYDLGGKKVAQLQNIKTNTIKFDVSDLAAAMYLLVLSRDGEVLLTHKMVKK